MTTASEPAPDRTPHADLAPPTPGAAGPRTPPAETAAERRRPMNQKNAARSHGQRTPEGRAVSSKNAYKLGRYTQAPVVPGGERRAFHAWLEGWVARYDPDGPAEINCVDRAAHASWE